MLYHQHVHAYFRHFKKKFKHKSRFKVIRSSKDTILFASYHDHVSLRSNIYFISTVFCLILNHVCFVMITMLTTYVYTTTTHVNNTGITHIHVREQSLIT